LNTLTISVISLKRQPAIHLSFTVAVRFEIYIS
jgi:hypothetical protein